MTSGGMAQGFDGAWKLGKGCLCLSMTRVTGGDNRRGQLRAGRLFGAGGRLSAYAPFADSREVSVRLVFVLQLVLSQHYGRRRCDSVTGCNAMQCGAVRSHSVTTC